MRTVTPPQKFQKIEHLLFSEDDYDIILEESSEIGDHEDALDNPGSSYLFVADKFHLDREDVSKLISIMQYWLDNKRIPKL